MMQTFMNLLLRRLLEKVPLSAFLWGIRPRNIKLFRWYQAPLFGVQLRKTVILFLPLSFRIPLERSAVHIAWKLWSTSSSASSECSTSTRSNPPQSRRSFFFFVSVLCRGNVLMVILFSLENHQRTWNKIGEQFDRLVSMEFRATDSLCDWR